MTCISLLLVTPVQAQKQQQQTGFPKGVSISQSTRLGADTLAQKFTELGQSDKAVAVLADSLRQQGFEPQTGPEDYIGWDVTLVKQDKGKVTASLIFQNYHNKATKDQAALGKLVISSGNNFFAYHLSLIAPGDDFAKAAEFTVDSNFNVVKTHSWSTCVYNRVSSQCGGSCWNAFSNCRGTWYQYIGCLVERCWCGIVASVCCLCNCSWWCSWLTGCCRQ
jgi:hypothetical protein